MSWQHNHLCRVILGGIVCLALVACTGPAREGSEQAEIQRPVWPKPPAQARIEFVRNVTKPEDLGISPGFWNRLVSIFVGNEEVRLVRPISVVMTAEEVLFVADPGSNAVHRFDVQRNKYDTLRLNDNTKFRSPVSLAIDADNRVYVADSALNQLYLIEPDSDHAVPFKTDIKLDQPTGLSFNPDSRHLYVVNTRKHQVLVFNQQGEHQFSFGTRGVGHGAFNYPTQIWSDPKTGDLWVTDSLNFRVQRFSKKGTYISTLSKVGDATGNLARPKGVATDSSGHVYIMDGLLNTMQIFNQDGDLLLYLGEQGRGIGQFWLPVGMFIDNDNRIFVADSFNNRIQVFRLLENEG